MKSYPGIKEKIFSATILGNPTTKKNSSKIVRIHGHYAVIPSKQYRLYEDVALKQLKAPEEPITVPVQVECIFYRDSKRRVDLTNLLEAIDDILVKAGVLEDDNANIIVSHDGSRVVLGSKEGKTEINIYKEEL